MRVRRVVFVSLLFVGLTPGLLDNQITRLKASSCGNFTQTLLRERTAGSAASTSPQGYHDAKALAASGARQTLRQTLERVPVCLAHSEVGGDGDGAPRAPRPDVSHDVVIISRRVFGPVLTLKHHVT